MKILLVLLILLLLFGCSSLPTAPATGVYPPQQKVIFWEGCKGETYAAEIEQRTGFPPIECPALAAELGSLWGFAMMVVGFPTLACVFHWQPYPEEPLFRKAITIFFPFAPEFMIRHEEDHIKGMWHFFLPFPEIKPSC